LFSLASVDCGEVAVLADSQVLADIALIPRRWDGPLFPPNINVELTTLKLAEVLPQHPQIPASVIGLPSAANMIRGKLRPTPAYLAHLLSGRLAAAALVELALAELIWHAAENAIQFPGEIGAPAAKRLA
jgi:hypothetical protein